MARTLPNCCVVLCIVCFVSFCVLCVCKRVLYFCHRVTTQLQLTNISYHIKSGNLNFLEPSGHSRPVTGLLYLLFASSVLVTKFPQRCLPGCDRLTFQAQGSAFVRRVGSHSLRRDVTSYETGIQSVESSLPGMLQSNTSCGATQQPHL